MILFLKEKKSSSKLPFKNIWNGKYFCIAKDCQTEFKMALLSNCWDIMMMNKGLLIISFDQHSNHENPVCKKIRCSGEERNEMGNFFQMNFVRFRTILLS